MDKTITNKWKVYYPFLWIVLGFLWLIIQLPHPFKIMLGKILGNLAFLFSTQTKHIVEVNLKLCFPRLKEKEYRTLLKNNFISLGIALIESAMAWLASNKQIRSLYTLKGYEHITQAFLQGKGIILITPHFTCVELVARFLSLENNFGILYRPHKKPWLASIQAFFRKRHFTYCIQSNQIRVLLHTLKANKAIWYAYDIDESGKRSVFAPFFGIPASSLTTVSDIVRLTGACVIPMHYFRCHDNLKYEIHFSPPLKDFPTEDKLNDATLLNSTLEEMVRKNPDQYVWPYKRFKTRPKKTEKRFYYSDNFPPRITRQGKGKKL